LVSSPLICQQENSSQQLNNKNPYFQEFTLWTNLVKQDTDDNGLTGVEVVSVLAIGTPSRIFVKDNYVYVADGYNGLYILYIMDISNPSSIYLCDR